MPNFDMIKQPRFPLITIDTNTPINQEQFMNLFDTDDGITLCIRSKNGHEKRGGYYFCIYKNNDNCFSLETMEQVLVRDFSQNDIIKFINHASGLCFDEEILQYCQNEVNFRAD